MWSMGGVRISPRHPVRTPLLGLYASGDWAHTQVHTGREVSKVLPHFNLSPSSSELRAARPIDSYSAQPGPSPGQSPSYYRFPGHRGTGGHRRRRRRVCPVELCHGRTVGVRRRQIETAALLLMLFTVAVMTFRSYMAIAGEIFTR